jgi:peptidoglycan/LPS O-acetylase OafA/YrhL
MQSTVPETHDRIATLDGVRGFAVVVVMCGHFAYSLQVAAGSTSERAMRVMFGWGWAGVTVFFALSGFLITGILLDAKGGSRYFRSFYARRMLRIFPLYYAVLAFYFLVVPHLLGPDYHVPVSSQLWYWTFFGNYQPLPWESKSIIGHFWTLAIEEQFYLLWPLVVYLCNRRQLVALASAVIVGSLVYRIIAVPFGTDVYHSTPGRIDALAAGALVAVAVRGADGYALLRRWCPIVGLAASVVMAVVVIRGGGVTINAPDFEMMAVGYGAVALMSAALVGGLVALDRGHWMSRVFSNRLLVTFGAYSYAIYVLHPGLQRVAGKLHLVPSAEAVARHPHWIVTFPLLMSMAALGGGYLSWHLYEKHFLKLKRFFAYGRRASVPAERAAS